MMESTKLSDQRNELVAYHKVKRKFLNLADIQNEVTKITEFDMNSQSQIDYHSITISGSSNSFLPNHT